jgi:ribosome-interacting GTPase 1
MATTVDKIKDIEAEMAKTQKNKVRFRRWTALRRVMQS